MLVRRLHAPGGARVSYLIACRETGQAAVVDPDDAVRAELDSLLHTGGLRLVAVLSTRPVLAGESPQEGRLDGLLHELAQVFDEGPSHFGDAAREARPGLAADCCWVRPVPLWTPHPDDPTPLPSVLTLLRIDACVAELWPAGELAPERDCFEAGAGAPFAISFRRARLEVGRLAFQILPLGQRCDALAFYVRDRLFTGQALHTGASRFTLDCTDDAFFGLPDGTVVHPGAAGHGVQVATVGQEREWREARTAGPERGRAPLHQAWVPVVHDGGRAGVRVGRVAPGGYRDVEPSEILPLLSTLRVIEMRLPREDEPGLPGAQSVSPTGWSVALAGWDPAAPVLVLSPMGVRCVAVATSLVRAGFQTVYRLVGGLALWVDSGLPVESEEEAELSTQIGDRL